MEEPGVLTGFLNANSFKKHVVPFCRKWIEQKKKAGGIPAQLGKVARALDRLKMQMEPWTKEQAELFTSVMNEACVELRTDPCCQRLFRAASAVMDSVETLAGITWKSAVLDFGKFAERVAEGSSDVDTALKDLDNRIDSLLSMDMGKHDVALPSADAFARQVKFAIQKQEECRVIRKLAHDVVEYATEHKRDKADIDDLMQLSGGWRRALDWGGQP